MFKGTPFISAPLRCTTACGDVSSRFRKGFSSPSSDFPSPEGPGANFGLGGVEAGIILRFSLSGSECCGHFVSAVRVSNSRNVNL